MGLGLSRVKKTNIDQADEQDEIEALEAASVARKQSSPEAATAAVAGEEAAEKDEFEALGDLIKEQPAPSINDDVSAPSAQKEADPAGEEASSNPEPVSEQPEAPKDEDELDPEEVSAFAKEHNLSEEEAAVMLKRERLEKAAREAGMSAPDARRVVDDEQKRRAMEEAMRAHAAAGGGGGGGITNLIADTVRMPFKAAAGAANAVNKKYLSKSPDAVRERMFKQWYEGYNKSLAAYENAGSSLKKNVEEFNAAFLNTNAASKLRDMAQANNQDLDTFLADLNRGKGSDEAMQLAQKALQAPKVAAAQKGIAEAEAKLAEAQQGMEHNLQHLAKNYGHDSSKIDLPFEIDRAEAVNEKTMKDLKKPMFEGTSEVAEKEQRKEFMERMRAIADAVRRMVENILNKLGLTSSGPAPAR